MAAESNSLARILFIEDDVNLRKSLTFILQREGFSVDSAGTGREGLRLARAAPPDLVLLDLLLPDMDGFAVCRELKACMATARAFIVMLTGKALVEDVVAGLDQFADDYITKPFEPAILLARLRAVLRRRFAAPDGCATALRPIVYRSGMPAGRCGGNLGGIDAQRIRYPGLAHLPAEPGLQPRPDHRSYPQRRLPGQ